MKLVIFPVGDEKNNIADILENVVLAHPYWRDSSERRAICLSILDKIPQYRTEPEKGLLLEDAERERLIESMKMEGMTLTPRAALHYFMRCSVALDRAESPHVS